MRLAFERGLCPCNPGSVGRQRSVGRGAKSPSEDLAASDGERHVERHRPTLKEHREPVALLHVARQALEIVEASDLLPVDLPDHVATLNSSFTGRSPILYARHDDALG